MNTEGLNGFGDEITIAVTLAVMIAMITIMIRDSLEGGV